MNHPVVGALAAGLIGTVGGAGFLMGMVELSSTDTKTEVVWPTPDIIYVYVAGTPIATPAPPASDQPLGPQSPAESDNTVPEETLPPSFAPEATPLAGGGEFATRSTPTPTPAPTPLCLRLRPTPVEVVICLPQLTPTALPTPTELPDKHKDKDGEDE